MTPPGCPGHRRLRLVRRRRNSGRSQDRPGLRRLCPDGDHRRHRAGHARRSFRQSGGARDRARPDRGGAERYRRRRHQDRHAGDGGDRRGGGRCAGDQHAFPWCWTRCCCPPAARRCWMKPASTILKKRLFRRAALVTPNLPETEALTGIYPRSEHRLRNAAMVFKMLGSEGVLFKGGHGEGAGRPRRAVDGRRVHRLSRRRARTRATPMAPAAPWPPPSPAAWRKGCRCRKRWPAPMPMCRRRSAPRRGSATGARPARPYTRFPASLRPKP